MRLRDRRAPLAALIIGLAYLLLITWPILLWIGGPARLPGWATALLIGNMLLLGWRMLLRFTSVRTYYGGTEAIRAVLRMPISSLIALVSVRRAFVEYVRSRRGGVVIWHKTSHVFPVSLPVD
jgi:bacteriophage N4 adsorption protein B